MISKKKHLENKVLKECRSMQMTKCYAILKLSLEIQYKPRKTVKLFAYLHEDFCLKSTNLQDYIRLTFYKSNC